MIPATTAYMVCNTRDPPTSTNSDELLEAGRVEFSGSLV